jgi:3',5'-cyclic AMP phosphodiesterase CpdA
MSRLVLLSDLHLSPTHGFFWQNWRLLQAAANAARADMVVVNGDLCINGPDSMEELIFARGEMDRLSSLHGARRVFALPGNHDVGDEPPGQDEEQLINTPRLAAWRDLIGPDRFAARCGAWWLVGINAQLCGSGLPEEAEQDDWLEGMLAIAGGRSIALFLHKPLFIEDPAESDATMASMNPVPRASLMARMAQHGVRLVVSGHLHQTRDVTLDGVRYLWAPAAAFAGHAILGADTEVGALVLDFSDAKYVMVEPLRPSGLVTHDLAAIKGNGRYAFLRDMPACPPPACLTVPA